MVFNGCAQTKRRLDFTYWHKKMNYITSCPACETQFLLTKEHLKAYRGKVQCGNCEHIFNAKNRLTEISDDITSAAEYQASLEAQEADAIENATENAEEKPISDVLNNVLEAVPNLENLNTIDPIQSAKSSYTSQHMPEVIESHEVESLSRPTIIEDLSTEPKYQPKRKINIWAMLACVLLTMLAGLQSIYSTRTIIAAEYPQFKPYLVQACTLLNCKIDLPKNLDFFTIDDSDMQENDTHQDVINFSSLLINNAPYTQAYPNIELTLTDTSDKPVLRRILKPAEYLASNTNVANGIISREEERINLAINVTDLAVAGYRVLLVY
jgi:predicted Zn finger-like uncharacterized protein